MISSYNVFCVDGDDVVDVVSVSVGDVVVDDVVVDDVVVVDVVVIIVGDGVVVGNDSSKQCSTGIKHRYLSKAIKNSCNVTTSESVMQLSPTKIVHK